MRIYFLTLVFLYNLNSYCSNTYPEVSMNTQRILINIANAQLDSGLNACLKSAALHYARAIQLLQELPNSYGFKKITTASELVDLHKWKIGQLILEIEQTWIPKADSIDTKNESVSLKDRLRLFLNALENINDEIFDCIMSIDIATLTAPNFLQSKVDTISQFQRDADRTPGR